MHVSGPHRRALSTRRVACISLFIFACIYVSKSQTRISINEYFVDSPPDVYVILAADTNYHYLLNTPFVVQHWANLGVKSAVLLAGTEEEYEKSMASKLAVEMLRELK
uniref:Acid phosphatase n=2 Tax=Bursaphelenchus xylophilus TaxID=6326 RepID=A0A1I7SI86_BURXY